MQCSETGVEIWLLFIVSSVLVILFEFRTRWFLNWLRMRRVRGRRFGNAPDVLFRPWGEWVLRAFGIIPVVMWAAGAYGVYCFFHGPG